MNNYQIRTVVLKDLIPFNSLVGTVAREKKYLSFLDSPPMDMTKIFIEENLRENWPHMVAEVDGSLIGWCDITSLHRPTLAHTGTLGIGVVPEWRGRGVGEGLMLAALEKAKLNGLTRIQLNVRENNTRAISLYDKLGFKIEGLHINAIRIDGIYENEYTMALLI